MRKYYNTLKRSAGLPLKGIRPSLQSSLSLIILYQREGVLRRLHESSRSSLLQFSSPSALSLTPSAKLISQGVSNSFNMPQVFPSESPTTHQDYSATFDHDAGNNSFSESSIQILDSTSFDVSSSFADVCASSLYSHLTPESANISSTFPTTLTDIARSSTGPVDLEPLAPSNVSQWATDKFQWSVDLARTNRIIFGNRTFRHNQKEAMNAHLAGKDVLVLMPTGYRLPPNWRFIDSSLIHPYLY
jgi:hypothetical protein